MNFGSLFAGIGGIDLGLERAGMTCKWQVEIDDFCQKILTLRLPIATRFLDVHVCGNQNLGKVDLIAGGFPCQPISVAGSRLGEEDERWLWDEYYRIIREIKPRWIMVENVAGLRFTANGKLFGWVLRDLAQSGYDAEWFSIFSGEKFGLPHKRERVFLLAYPPGLGWNLLGDKTRNQIERSILQAQNKSGYRWRLKDGGHSAKSVGWVVEPNIRGGNDGIPSELDKARIKALGNAVVPQVAEHIGRMIMEANK